MSVTSVSKGLEVADSSTQISRANSAIRGRELIASRMKAAPDVVAGIPQEFSALKALRGRLPRMLVSTGIGTSEGHARHLAEVANRFCSQPARFISTGALAAGPPPGAEQDWLVVFSQGLSANARFAFSHAASWRGVILVTGLGMEAGEEVPAEKADWCEALDRMGVIRLNLGAGTEYGTLLRVIGARAGYAVSWSLLRSLASMRLESAPALACDAWALRRSQDEADASAQSVFGPNEKVSPFFASDRALLLVSEEGALEFVDQLSLKLSEGLLRPRPRAVDVLEFAHGPLQSLAEKDASILYVKASLPRSRTGEGESGAKVPDSEESWLDRFRSTLDPERHWLRVVESTLPWPFAAIELEAIFDEFVLRAITEVETNLVDWPGAEREAALYEASPRLPEGKTNAIASAYSRDLRGIGSVAWESRTWPEAEAGIAAGRRTALVGLGSIEQHGRHLPLGTDRWIAEALLQALEATLDDAVALPAIPVGCASEHLDFAGTLHIEPATLEALLVDLLRSLSHHGFERAFLFTAHGGNLDALAEMGTRLTEAVLPLKLRIETDLRIGAMQSEVVEAEALSPLAAGPHAGEYETSLIAHLRPGSIREEHLVPGRVVEPGEAQALFYPSLRPNTESGVLGDPSSAIADRGQRYLQAWVDLLASGYRAAFPAAASSEKNPR